MGITTVLESKFECVNHILLMRERTQIGEGVGVRVTDVLAHKLKKSEEG